MLAGSASCHSGRPFAGGAPPVSNRHHPPKPGLRFGIAFVTMAVATDVRITMGALTVDDGRPDDGRLDTLIAAVLPSARHSAAARAFRVGCMQWPAMVVSFISNLTEVFNGYT